MTTFMKLNTMTAMVREVLEQYPSCRDSDKELILTILQNYYGVRPTASIEEVLTDDNLPNFETIRRCRQKAQEEDPSLRGTARVEAGRYSQQAEYIAFARGEMI